MSDLFREQRLNHKGKNTAMRIGDQFEDLLEMLQTVCPTSREFALCRTHLEQACFYAKKAMANYPENREVSA